MTYLTISELGECLQVTEQEINNCNAHIKQHLQVMLQVQEQMRAWIIAREQHEKAMERLIQRARSEYK